MGDDTRAQSELIGVLLLTGVVVVLSFTVGGLLFTNATNEASADPLVSIQGNATSQYVTVRHAGGERLDVSALTVILRGGGTERYAFETFTQRQGDDSARFEPGDEWRRTHGITGDEMEVILIDEKSNSVVDRIRLDIVATIAARFETAPKYPREGESITFDAGKSSVSGSTLEHYVWEFGDGATTNETSEETTHTYAEDGNYNVTLRVKSADGRAADLTKTVTVYNEAPTANFTYSAQSLEVGKSISFDGTGSSDSDGSISRYEWDFGDGAAATGATPTHTYSSPGNYTVSLTVTDNDGSSRTTNREIRISDSRPSVSTVSVEDAPINYSDAATTQNITVVFDEPMNTSVLPSVTVTNDEGATVDATPDVGWINATAYSERVNIRQTGIETTATVSVSDGRDTDDNVQNPNPDESNTFLIDTDQPGDIDSIRTPIIINASNESAVPVVVTNPSTLDGDEEIRVSVTGPNGVTVSNETAAQNAGGDETVVLVDASPLADGTTSFTAEAIAVDDVQNTGSAAQVNTIKKDTVAPTVDNFTLTKEAEDRFTVTVEGTDVTTGVKDLSLSFTGPGTVTRTNANNNTGSFELTYEVSTAGQYQVTLDALVDGLNNNGATGQSRTITLGNPTITSGAVAADNTYVDVTFSEGVYTNSDGSDGVTTSDLDLTLARNGGNVSSATIDSVTTTGNTTPSGGETTLRVRLALTSRPATGEEDIEITPADGSSIYDGDGFAMAESETTGTLQLNDNSKPDVTVRAPDGGEVLRGGENYTITWSASDSGVSLNSPTDIAYTTDGGSSYTTIVTDTDNDESYTWTVPEINSSSVQVRVNVTDSAGNTGTDESDGTFTVDSTRPTVTVDDPNGGEALVAGSDATIQWIASDTLSGVDSVDIGYSTDSGGSYTTIATGEANDGSYAWSVPSVDTANALVRVTATDNANNTRADASDSTFAIDNAAPTIDTFSGVTAFKGNATVLIDSLTVSDSASGLTDVDVVVRDAAGTVIGSNNATGLGGAATFNRTDLKISTDQIKNNEQYTVTVTATDRVSNEGSASETTTTSGPVADANGPYTVDEGGTVTLDGSGSDPQTNPTYEWTIVSSSPGGDSISQDTSTSNATYNAPSNVDSDTDVTVRLTITERGTTYTDEATVTIRNISANDGGGSTTAGFGGSVSASDMSRDSNSATQTFDFTLNETLADGETVTINLDNAQGVKGGQNDPDPVDYRDASVDAGSSTLAGGSAGLSATQDTASVTYTANGDVNAGTAVTIQVNGVATTKSNAGPVDVVFSRSDGTSETTTFALTK